MPGCGCCFTTSDATICADCEALMHALKVNGWVWRELEYKILQTHYRTHDRADAWQEPAQIEEPEDDAYLDGYLAEPPKAKYWILRRHPELEWLACRTAPALDFYQQNPQGLRDAYPSVGDLEWEVLLTS